MFAGLCWGVGFPLGKVALREMDAAHMVLLRFAVGSVFAAPFALLSAEARALFRSPPVLAAGALYGLAFLVQFEGLARVNVSLASLLVGAMPALIAVLARLLGEPVSRLSWVGVGAATLGAALIAGRPGEAGTPLGVALSIIALFIFLAWLAVLRKAPKVSGAMAIPAVTVILATAVLAPVTLALHGAPPTDLSPVAWVAILGQGLLSTFLAVAAWQFALARVGSTTAGVFVNIEPLMGSTIGVLLFDDPLTLGITLGGAMILAGSIMVVTGERKASAGPMAQAPATPA